MALAAKSPQAQNGEIEEIDVFKRFDVVSDDSDHFYLTSNRPKRGGGDCFSNAGTEVHKKIMKEWRILEKNLPDSIFVRVYEKRIDLLRAVIVGAVGTPYHDGLFFFDIAFPSDYPNQPPLVHYRSYGLRLNPNLYASGKVCLSLINTWSGKKSEKWNSSESTLLQVLVSIQALVLNEKPYFNEPGNGMFGKAIWEKKSQAYNENVFVLSCKTMLFLLRRTPKNFERFVLEHFRERSYTILRACNEYTNGRVKVGYYRNDGSSSSSPIIDVSDRFKASIVQLYPELVATFRKLGASLGNSVEQLDVEKKIESYKKQVSDKKNIRIANKVFAKIKKVLGLKKKKSTNGIEDKSS
ncbi:Ubiquitin-conjugating enzyme [Quillaja saponaria]|uniref:Ubiquitin-conjugating enzyme n=1 Tax=Quillaja saponaria TaxID=32244 RepID=A0AAD7LD75_QUISA|nr:Ubiquitin-conjugating enzyme [Quillaja saponaria]